MSAPKCKTCDGHGEVLLARSWFPTDGYQRRKCWMCDGSGSSRQPDALGNQRRLRAELAAQKTAAHEKLRAELVASVALETAR